MIQLALPSQYCFPSSSAGPPSRPIMAKRCTRMNVVGAQATRLPAATDATAVTPMATLAAIQEDSILLASASSTGARLSSGGLGGGAIGGGGDGA